MASMSRNDTTSLPQGFSVYQPVLGAQLQFFPVIGSPELDAMVNEYIPGPASLQEKRASIALDFFEFTQLTGQSFKFYPVYSVATPADSVSTASPYHDSGYGSSFNVSPVMSSWDWSGVPANNSPPQQQRGQSNKATSSRQPADFSNIPGMKIMTKDGLDVTNSASRGSKTKEQRDHAHLMRIIKACDSCRRKKIRCDPSHKKRTAAAAAAAPSSSQAAAKVVKKSKAASRQPRVVDPVVAQDGIELPGASLAMDDLIGAPDLDIAAPSAESWEQFIQYPADMEADYDFFYDPNGYLSPQSSFSLSSDSAKAISPTSQSSQGVLYQLPEDNILPAAPPQLPYNAADVSGDYVDFNLFSPASSFSEDERMVSIESRSRTSQSPHGSAGSQLYQGSPGEVSYRDPGAQQDSALFQLSEANVMCLQQSTSRADAVAAGAAAGLPGQDDYGWSIANATDEQDCGGGTLTADQQLRDVAESRYGNVGVHQSPASREEPELLVHLRDVVARSDMHRASDQPNGGNVDHPHGVSDASSSRLAQMLQLPVSPVTDQSVDSVAGTHDRSANDLANGDSFSSSQLSSTVAPADLSSVAIGGGEDRRQETITWLQAQAVAMKSRDKNSRMMPTTSTTTTTTTTRVATTATATSAFSEASAETLSDTLRSRATDDGTVNIARDIDVIQDNASISGSTYQAPGHSSTVSRSIPSAAPQHAPWALTIGTNSRAQQAPAGTVSSRSSEEMKPSASVTSHLANLAVRYTGLAAAVAVPFTLATATFGLERPMAYTTTHREYTSEGYPVWATLAAVMVLFAVTMWLETASWNLGRFRGDKLCSTLRSRLDGPVRKRLPRGTSPVNFPTARHGYQVAV